MISQDDKKTNIAFVLRLRKRLCLIIYLLQILYNVIVKINIRRYLK